VFTVIPQFQKEAESIIAGLLPYLQFCNPGNDGSLEKSFTVGAVKRWMDATWDPINYCVRTQDDAIVQFILDGDPEFDFSELLSSATAAGYVSQTLPLTQLRQRPGATLYGQDSDSVSTMGTKASKSTTASARAKRLSVSFQLPAEPSPMAASSPLVAPTSDSTSLTSPLTQPSDSTDDKVSVLSLKVDLLTSQIQQLLQLRTQSLAAEHTPPVLTQHDHSPEKQVMFGAGSFAAAGAGSS